MNYGGKARQRYMIKKVRTEESKTARRGDDREE